MEHIPFQPSDLHFEVNQTFYSFSDPNNFTDHTMSGVTLQN